MDRSESALFVSASLKKAIDQCRAFAQLAEPGEIGVCVGPSGAGKTRLSQYIGPHVYGTHSTWNDGRIPFIRVIADNPDRGFFSPKELARAMLVELRDPFRSWPGEIAQWEMQDSQKINLLRAVDMLPRKVISEPQMRQVIASVGRLRNLRLIIIDEANMLVLTHYNRAPTDYLESLRTLGKKTGASVLLFGTVDLLAMMGYSAQLNRSITYILLDRVRADDKAGELEFARMLLSLEGSLGLPRGILRKHSAEVFNWTYGIPGEIVALVKRARVLGSCRPEELTWTILTSASKSNAEVGLMRFESDIVFKALTDGSVSNEEWMRLSPRRAMSQAVGRRRGKRVAT